MRKCLPIAVVALGVVLLHGLYGIDASGQTDAWSGVNVVSVYTSGEKEVGEFIGIERGFVVLSKTYGSGFREAIMIPLARIDRIEVSLADYQVVLNHFPEKRWWE